LAGFDRRPLGLPGERPQGFGIFARRPSIGRSCKKARRTRAGVSFSGGRGGCQGRRCSTTRGRARRSWTYARISNQVQRSAASLERSLGVVQLPDLFAEAKHVFDGEPSDIDSPNGLQIWRIRSPPPEPEGDWRFRRFGEVLHLQANERPVDERASLARSLLLVVVWDRMQSSPAADPHLAIIRIGRVPLVSWHGPGGGIVTDERGPHGAVDVLQLVLAGDLRRNTGLNAGGPGHSRRALSTPLPVARDHSRHQT
jgi:hypothetical protein